MNLSYTHITKYGKVPEANIQAEFYRLCRQNGIPVLLEVTYDHCRFDILVFRNDRPFAIVEVKNFGTKGSMRGLKKTGRQYTKYKKFGIPIIELLNSRQIFTRFNELQIMLQNADNQ
mgnify:CR=1 FL=1|jgi:hypothetical protein